MAICLFVVCWWAQKERQIKAVLCRLRLLSKHLVTPPLRLVKLPNTCSIVDILGEWDICSICFDIDAIRSDKIHINFLTERWVWLAKGLAVVYSTTRKDICTNRTPTESETHSSRLGCAHKMSVTMKWLVWVSPTNTPHNFLCINIKYRYVLSIHYIVHRWTKCQFLEPMQF